MNTPGHGEDSAAQLEAPRSRAFKRLISIVPVPQDAQAAWLDNTHFPVTSFLLYHGSSSANIALTASYFFIGSLHYPSRLVRHLSYAAGTLSVGCLAVPHGMCVVYGPDLALRRPSVFIAATGLGSATTFAFLIFNVCSSEDYVPYASRFVFLLTLAAGAIFAGIAGLLSWQSTERGPPSTHPAKTCVRAVMRSLRFLDASSDAMVVRIMWERIDRKECSWFGVNDCHSWTILWLMLFVSVAVDFAAGFATSIAGKAMETSSRQCTRQIVLAMHLVCFLCEFFIIVIQILAMVSRGEQSSSNYLVLAASLLTTCAIAYLNVKGSTEIISDLLLRTRRVRDDVSRLISRMSVHGRRSSAGGRSAAAITKMQADDPTCACVEDKTLPQEALAADAPALGADPLHQVRVDDGSYGPHPE